MTLLAVGCPSNVTSRVLVGLTPIIPLCLAISGQLGCPCCPLAGGRTTDPEQFGPWESDHVSAQLLQPPQLPSVCQQHVGTGTIPLPQMWLQLNAENSPTPCSSPRNLLAPFLAAPLLGHGGARGLTWCCPSPAPFPSLVDAVKPCCSRCCGCARCHCLVPAGGAGLHGKSS